MKNKGMKSNIILRNVLRNENNFWHVVPLLKNVSVVSLVVFFQSFS
jgi:hypothetical protein